MTTIPLVLPTRVACWFVIFAWLALVLQGCGNREGPESVADTPRDGPSDTSTATSPSASSSHSTAGPEMPPEMAPPELGPPFESKERVDAIIRGGMVVDGTGRPRYQADVVIDKGTIAHIGTVADSVKALREVDAAGKVVTPGFIDTHSHGDPEARNKYAIAQGITTLCVGQDGSSASHDRVSSLVARLRKKKLAVNVALFVGHGTVRNLAKVGLSKSPSAKQIERMARIVGKELDAGAWGLSSGLEYRPGIFATADELAAIAKPVAERDGVIMSHLRSEDDDKVEGAIDELVAQGRVGARVHIAHMKVVYGKGAGRADKLLAHLAGVRAEGVAITADIYPYNASYTTISIVFPDFAKPPNSYKRVKRNKRDELAEFLRNKIARRGGPEATLFGTSDYGGKTLKQVADEQGKPFEEVLIELGPGAASAAYFVMNDELQSRLITDPHVMIGTDGGALSRHPRGYGTFSKVLRLYVNERALLTLEEAVRKMTGLPAATVGLAKQKRGLLQKGWAADVLVFDPAAIADKADYQKPSRLSEGMDWVFVNGRSVVREGKFTKTRPGNVLRRE